MKDHHLKKVLLEFMNELNIHCQPVAINSGFVWPKKGKKKANKEITISILKPINPGLNKDEFIKKFLKKIFIQNLI